MHKPDIPSGERPYGLEWAKHLRSRKNKYVGRSDAQLFNASCRKLVKNWIKREGWNS